MNLLNKYKYVLFDCDGVILNSNKIKSNAFYQVAKRYDPIGAKRLKMFSESVNGLSRRQIFTFFAEEILKEKNYESLVDSMVQEFSVIVKSELLECEIVKRLAQIKSINRNSRWMVVSGGDQIELRSIFLARDILSLFELGVFGSPRTKNVIIKEEFLEKNLLGSTIFFGDSRTDYEVAKYWGFDFVFVGAWSDLIGWQKFCETEKIRWVLSLDEIDQ